MHHSLPRLVHIDPFRRRPIYSGTDTLNVIEIQLLQFSTSKPHPSAKLQPLTVAILKQESGRPDISLEILGRYLAIVVSNGKWVPDIWDQFVLFDWKKGTIIMACFVQFACRVSLLMFYEYSFPHSHSGGTILSRS
jgi:hypothetical protein